MQYLKKPMTVAISSALLGVIYLPSSIAEMPATEHQAEVMLAPEHSLKQWNKRIQKLPVTLHQREVLQDFNKSDMDGSGMLSREEYSTFVAKRAQRMYYNSLHSNEKHGVDARPARERAYDTAGGAVIPKGDKPDTDKSKVKKVSGKDMQNMVITSATTRNATMRTNITAAAMLDLDKQYDKADRKKDGQLGFHEVYYYETFDRPSLFPKASESIPQAVSGHWENATVGEHGQVYHQAPFSAAKHKQATEEGGFVAVDENEDGVVSVFEASDFSLLTWSGAIRAFDNADVDDSATLTKKEFENFQSAIAKTPEQDERPGEFPSGRMKSDS